MGEIESRKWRQIIIAKITNIHLCRMGSDRKYSSILYELLLGANSIIYLYEHIYISAVWGVTENTKVFPLEYCIMYTIFGYLIMISNIVCPSFWWMLFPSKVCPFSCGIIIMSFICEELQVLPTSYCQIWRDIKIKAILLTS